MRSVLIALSVFLLGATLTLAAMDPAKPLPPTPSPVGPQGDAVLLPGDTMADAIPIPNLPFAAAGSTVGYAMNYGDMCPFGCLGPDVVYGYTPGTEEFVKINLCNQGTDFDTNLYVYRNDQNHMVACNEDGCSAPGYPDPYLSRVHGLRVQPGNTYYIVVSGYCGYAGSYQLTVASIGDPFLVRPDGSGAFPDIQSAIEQAADGDTIKLADGVFTGQGNRELHYYGKRIVIRSLSADPNACILDPQGVSPAVVFDNGEGPASVLDGVTIRNGFPDYSDGGGAIVCYSAYPTIRRCVFLDNRAGVGGACAFWNSAVGPTRATVEDCLFQSNQATDEGGAVYCLNYAGDLMPSIQRCTFTGNSARRGGAIAIHYGRPEIVNCTIVKNATVDSTGMGGGIYSPNASVVTLQNTVVAFNHSVTGAGVVLGAGTVSCCDIYHNDGGNWIGSPNPSGFNGNISLDPRFCDYENRNFTLAADSPCRPFSAPNPECGLIGAWDVACAAAAVDGVAGPGPERVSVYPSPFAGSCRIVLRGPHPPAAATLTVNDVTGRVVRRLAVGAANAGPATEIPWDGRDDDGRPLPSGVYLVRLGNSTGSVAGRVILAR